MNIELSEIEVKDLNAILLISSNMSTLENVQLDI